MTRGAPNGPLRWPMIATKAAPISSRPAENPALDVLIVDDEPLIRWSLKTGLTRRGHRVTEAADGAGALRLFADAPAGFHVVLLDYRLPDRQDLSLLRDIRAICPSCSVIMMTAFADPSMRQEALSIGAVALIDKPFQVDAVVALIESTPGAAR